MTVGGRIASSTETAFRELARRREPVRVELVDEVRRHHRGGRQRLPELAEHELGEVRRRVAVRARRFVGFEAVVAVTVPPARR